MGLGESKYEVSDYSTDDLIEELRRRKCDINNISDDTHNITIISLDGNIGSGKSTFLEMLKEYYKDDPRILFADEPTKIWFDLIDEEDGKNVLNKFYDDQEAWAYKFQNVAYISRVITIDKAVKEAKETGAQIIITERSTLTDRRIFAKMLLDDGKMTELEHSLYDIWYGFIDLDVDNIIAINTDVDTCVERISMRGRPEEQDIPYEYLKNLDNYHKDWWLSEIRPIFEIDGTQEFNSENIELIESVDNFIMSLI